MAEQLATFQGRLVLSSEEDTFLADYADRYGCVERALQFLLRQGAITGSIVSNKTRQGYARKRILKPAGYSFSGGGQ